MTRSSLLYGLFGLVGVGLLGLAPLACSVGGVGDPCIPEDEYDPQFPGFTLSLENIESRSFQCQTRICLVNHVQGRVSCPLGQTQPKACGVRQGDGSVGKDPSQCDTGEDCVETVAIAQDCNPMAANTCPPPGACNKDGKFCECTTDQVPPATSYICDTKTKQFRSFLCHKKNNCQANRRLDQGQLQRQRHAEGLLRPGHGSADRVRGLRPVQRRPVGGIRRSIVRVGATWPRGRRRIRISTSAAARRASPAARSVRSKASAIPSSREATA